MSARSNGRLALVTGGAGFIGSHLVDRLLRDGHAVTAFDNLSTGHRASVRVPFEQVDLGDREALAGVFLRHRPVAVVHFAAKCYVGESVTEPAKYYRENVIHTWNLLEAMRARFGQLPGFEAGFWIPYQERLEKLRQRPPP